MNAHQCSRHRRACEPHSVRSATSPRECWLREANCDDMCDIVDWLARPAIAQWFDFGLGRQSPPILAVQAMTQSDRHRLRVFGVHGTSRPSGLVAISDVTHRFGLGSFWVLRDPTRAACANITLAASGQVLREGFERDKLHCISAWAAQSNVRSQRLLTRLGFRLIGLQRNCHVIDGQRMGRLLYDLLPQDLSFPTPI
ncbi:GNAT family N-acetyltransferase [Burkholderia cenocepacia]|uniref:GNAT family N-acetyltransferase n=1 Tax=Burkholderia cenocepacia TaxID=95486 RepID=UPI000F5ABFF5|nr:GNAT family N-acetyltransferase [Burkholderia cenocepacia]MDN7683611.1 GNAT family N-acetyltransferase [Burkholderia cenocepacia]RQU61556.1 N-acetyltransferase [Burkholderia cenocepacia]RQV44131.1 N-acetyltransferase [Burkholderia cenocepacia]UJH76226.1 GNAT family N-acetyltransferase [Burkholderia cenocepacia]